MATYTLVYRDDEGDHEVTETLENVDDVQREDGIVSLERA
jgi:translation elongation factor EF-1beta